MAPRPRRKFTAVTINALSKPGYHGDGDGLYLRITQSGVKLWAFRYRWQGRQREAGLGGYPAVSLKDARERASEFRALLWRGQDPIEVRKATAASGRPVVTFEQSAEDYIGAHSPSWRNPKHRQQWSNTLKTYVYPVFGHLPVDQIDTTHVLQALEPIWTGKTETATRVRQRIESILDAATAKGLRRGENPARWRGHLDTLLPRPSKVKTVVNHPALPYPELPAFLRDLRSRDGIAARALEFAILTATRTGEVLGAQWAEIDNDLWTIPGERMKAGRPHRVPLTPAAVAVLARLPQTEPFVFSGKARRGLSNGALLAVLRRMGRMDITPHGFRSCFRDWAAEQTNVPRDVCEAALAHTIKDKTESAYRRGDMLDKRRALMTAWSDYCMSAEISYS